MELDEPVVVRSAASNGNIVLSTVLSLSYESELTSVAFNVTQTVRKHSHITLTLSAIDFASRNGTVNSIEFANGAIR